MKKDVTFIILGIGIAIAAVITPILFYGVEVSMHKEFVVPYIFAISLIELLCYIAYKADNDCNKAKIERNDKEQ